MSLHEDTTVYTLNDGNKIPAIGLGTWRTTPPDSAKDIVKAAIDNGYRHIDTAAVYGNEEEVGQGIHAANVPREELFITTKLWNTEHNNVKGAFEESLKKLGLDYVDLYLIHWPLDGEFDDKNATINESIQTYLELQKLKESGKAKSIGVSNYTKKRLEALLAHPEVTVTPAVLQIEAHPLLPQPELYDFAKQHDIRITAYSPLGGDGAPLFKDDTVKSLAEKYNAHPAQILVSWAVQRRTVVLPKSVKTERLISNKKVVTFSDEDFALLNALAEKEGATRTNNPLPAIFED